MLLATVRADPLDVHILPGGDHRLQRGDGFTDGYLELLTGIVRRRAAA